MHSVQSPFWQAHKAQDSSDREFIACALPWQAQLSAR